MLLLHAWVLDIVFLIFAVYFLSLQCLHNKSTFRALNNGIDATFLCKVFTVVQGGSWYWKQYLINLSETPDFHPLLIRSKTDPTHLVGYQIYPLLFMIFNRWGCSIFRFKYIPQ